MASARAGHTCAGRLQPVAYRVAVEPSEAQSSRAKRDTCKRYDGTSASVQAVTMAAIPVGSHPCAGRAILRRVSPVAQLECMTPIVRKRSVDAAAACGGSRDNVDCAPSRSRVLAAGQARVGAERRASSQARVEQAGGRRYLSGAEERFKLDRERDHTPSLENIERETERPHWRQKCGYPISERSWE